LLSPFVLKSLSFLGTRGGQVDSHFYRCLGKSDHILNPPSPYFFFPPETLLNERRVRCNLPSPFGLFCVLYGLLCTPRFLVSVLSLNFLPLKTTPWHFLFFSTSVFSREVLRVISPTAHLNGKFLSAVSRQDPL